MKLTKFKTILLDGDGVLWKSDNPIPGINPFFEFLAGNGINWALLTNNNTRTAQDYIDKLAKFGISANSNSVFTSSTTTAEYLLERFGQGGVSSFLGREKGHSYCLRKELSWDLGVIPWFPVWIGPRPARCWVRP